MTLAHVCEPPNTTFFTTLRSSVTMDQLPDDVIAGIQETLACSLLGGIVGAASVAHSITASRRRSNSS